MLSTSSTFVKFPSTVAPQLDDIISDDTIGSSVYTNVSFVLFLNVLLINSLVTFSFNSTTKSTNDPSDTGTLIALPIILPSN